MWRALYTPIIPFTNAFNVSKQSQKSPVGFPKLESLENLAVLNNYSLLMPVCTTLTDLFIWFLLPLLCGFDFRVPCLSRTLQTLTTCSWQLRLLMESNYGTCALTGAFAGMMATWTDHSQSGWLSVRVQDSLQLVLRTDRYESAKFFFEKNISF